MIINTGGGIFGSYLQYPYSYHVDVEGVFKLLNNFGVTRYRGLAVRLIAEHISWRPMGHNHIFIMVQLG